MITARVVFLVALLTVMVSETAKAGYLHARRPGSESPLYNLRASKIRVDVRIRNLLAITHVDEEFRNDEGIDLEGFYVFELPDNATVDGLWLWIDGKRTTFIVKRKEEAERVYDSLVQNGIGDPAILEMYGANRFQLKIHPIEAGQTRRIELQYFEALPMNKNGTARYYYPLNLAGYQSVEVERVQITIDMNMKYPLGKVTTNFDDRPLMISRTALSEFHLALDFTHEYLRCAEDFGLEFHLDGWYDDFPMLAYTDPDTTADGYFVMWHPVDIGTDEMTKGDFVFVLDQSASMCGFRRSVLLEAFENVLDRLQPYDRFRVVFFSGETTSWPPDTSMLFMDMDQLLIVKQFVRSRYVPGGITDYEAGIREGLRCNFREEADRRMVFFTDGLPNRGATAAAQLAPLFMSDSIIRARFFAVTCYTERIEMLYDLAQDLGGKLAALEQGDDLASVLERLTFDFSGNSIRTPVISFPPNIYLTLPTAFPYIVQSERLLSAGRFVEGTEGNCTLQFYSPGSTGKKQTLSRNMQFATDTLDPVQVSRIWAGFRIQKLLEELKSVQDSSEIVESIVRLSEKFMILSPFTAFIVFEDVEIIDPTAIAGIPSPAAYALLPNYPNPFNPSTSIQFHVPISAGGHTLTLRIYNELGILVKTLWDGPATPGLHTVVWHGTDDFGRALSSGLYFCVFRGGDQTFSITMTLQK